MATFICCRRKLKRPMYCQIIQKADCLRLTCWWRRKPKLMEEVVSLTRTLFQNVAMASETLIVYISFVSGPVETSHKINHFGSVIATHTENILGRLLRRVPFGYQLISRTSGFITYIELFLVQMRGTKGAFSLSDDKISPDACLI